MILSILTFAGSSVLRLFTRQGVRQVQPANVAMIAIAGAVIVGLLWLWNPFDDKATREARAAAKRETIAAASCNASLKTLAAENQALALRSTVAASEAGAKARAEGSKALDNLRHENTLLAERIAKLTGEKSTGGLSRDTLKEMSR